MYFEQLIAYSISKILHLPFYAIDNDDSNASYRVTWQGSTVSGYPLPTDSTDAIAYCYGFYLTIEATRRTGALQWSEEFARAVRHCDNFCSTQRKRKEDVLILLVCTDLHIDTYRSIRRHPQEEYKLIPLKVSHLAKILETSILGFTMRNLDVRKLLLDSHNCIGTSGSVKPFLKDVDRYIEEWQKKVLKLEVNAFIGTKSYKVMQEFRRDHVGVSEILQQLRRNPIVGQYFRIIGAQLQSSIITESLVHQGFASLLSHTMQGEEIFEPVPYADIKSRQQRIMYEVTGLNE